MKPHVRFVLFLTCLAVFGCSTPQKPEENSSDYVPLKDRPPSGKEYWEQRGKQDEIERRIEERTNRPQ